MKKNLLIICLISFSFYAFGQSNNLEKAIKKGKDDRLRYTASFKNISIKKEPKIKAWCKDNGYVVVKIYIDEKDAFGGNKKKYITLTTFRTNEDDLFLRANSRNTIELYTEYLDKYPKGIHLKEIQNKLVKVVDQLTTCKELSEKYPSISAPLLDRAFALAQLKNKPYLFTTFLRHFPDSKYENQVFQLLCKSMPDIKTAYNFYKKYPIIKDCLEDKAYALALKSKSLKKYSEFVNTFEKGKNRTRAEKVFLDNLNSIALCNTYYDKHPDLKNEIDNKAIAIAQKGGIESKRQYSKIMLKGKNQDKYAQEVTQHDEAVAAEKVRKEKERKAKIAAEALAIKQEKERKARLAKEKKEHRLAQIKKNGKVLRTYDNGSKYEGGWFENKRNGYGRMDYPDGSYYLGNWENGLKHGKGKLYYKNGELDFDGEFVNGKADGIATRFYKSGNKYHGEYMNNVRHGWGRMDYADGSYYIGNWSNGEKHGEGSYYKNGSLVYSGKYEFGDRKKAPAVTYKILDCDRKYKTGPCVEIWAKDFIGTIHIRVKNKQTWDEYSNSCGGTRVIYYDFEPDYGQTSDRIKEAKNAAFKYGSAISRAVANKRYKFPDLGNRMCGDYLIVDNKAIWSGFILTNEGYETLKKMVESACKDLYD